jgi:colanic acid biosynthesis protein WcaH
VTDSPEPYTEMEIHDERIPEAEFAAVIDHMPQVCVDIVLETDEGFLIAKRDIEPRVWFWPGSRLYKGERLEDAAHRIAREELGIAVRIVDQYGPYAHFWSESSIAGSPSRHTVNPVFHVEPESADFEIDLDEQHSEYRFLDELDPDLHEYVQLYLTDNDLV